MIREFTEDRLKMGEEKGVSYANSETDRLANFKGIAADLGTTPEVILMVYLGKHLRSIHHWVKTGATPDGDLNVHSDGIAGRIADATNYLDLLYAMMRERLEVSARQTPQASSQAVGRDTGES